MLAAHDRARRRRRPRSRSGGSVRRRPGRIRARRRTRQYDGRFTFARLKYTRRGPAGYYYCGLPAWAHGYASCRGGQRAERSLMKIMNEVSYLGAHIEDSVVLALDDPELFKYPVAYMTEPGFWTMNDKEAAALRAYLQKGGFIIFDDFRDDAAAAGGGWQNFEDNMRRVLPGAQLRRHGPVAIRSSTRSSRSTRSTSFRRSYDRGRPEFFAASSRTTTRKSG